MFRQIARLTHGVLQIFMYGLVILLALASLALLGAGLAGYLPWPEVMVDLGEFGTHNAGPWLIGAVAAFFVGLASFLPSNKRILQLETSHRNFHIRMEDVAKAYYVAHQADRTGVFTMTSEFDGVRERLAFLRDHPDLATLEAGVLEVSAQMSETSRDLATTYSDEAVARARNFLDERTEELLSIRRRIDTAKREMTDIRSRTEATLAASYATKTEVEELRMAAESMLSDLSDIPVQAAAKQGPKLKAVTTEEPAPTKPRTATARKRSATAKPRRPKTGKAENSNVTPLLREPAE
ncbi:DNA repair protein [Pseudaestuariivita sp.]|uniref:DNA repair protein n=1 Tax=Pseudaestuariivita sp. TaxID=2211669 RepID=UPI004059F226